MQFGLMLGNLLKMMPIAIPPTSLCCLSPIIHTSLNMQLLLSMNLHNNDLICDRIIKVIKSAAFISALAIKLEAIKIFGFDVEISSDRWKLILMLTFRNFIIVECTKSFNKKTLNFHKMKNSCFKGNFFCWTIVIL